MKKPTKKALIADLLRAETAHEKSRAQYNWGKGPYASEATNLYTQGFHAGCLEIIQQVLVSLGERNPGQSKAAA